MFTTVRSRFAVLLLGLGWLGCAQNALAEDPDPSSRVARLSYLQGEVSMQPADADAWVEAQLNRPLTTDDRLWTDRGSRAELQLGSAAIQLDQSTGLTFLELSDDVTQIRLSEGVINVRVKRLRDETIEIDTPNAAVSLQEPGTYRLEVSAAGDATVVKVRSGRAGVAGDRQNFTLDSREAAEFRGTDRLAAEFFDIGSVDDFDAWALDRNQRAERSASTRYVSTEVIGYEDLDSYGDWRYDSDYGYVWYPVRVSAGWAPYRYGHWAWVAPWGWTWIDEAPWGFAPFHYGRWAYRASRWCWVPGPAAVRPVYAPALVAWMGTPGVSISISVGGSVGWFPLGPREVYIPSYRSSRTYVQNINISNTHVTNVYVNDVYERRNVNVSYMNRTAPRALSLMERDSFVRGRAVAGHMVRVDQNAERQWSPSPKAPDIRPTRESTLGSARVRAAPPVNLNRPVVALRDPARNLEQSSERRARQRDAITLAKPENTRNPGRPAEAPSFDSGVTRRNGQAAGERPESPTVSDRPARRLSTDNEQRDGSALLRGRNQDTDAYRSDSARRENPRVNRSAPQVLPDVAAPARDPGNDRAPVQRPIRQREDRAASSPWVQQESRLQERRNMIQANPAQPRGDDSAPRTQGAPPRNAEAGQAEQPRRQRGKEENRR